MLTFTSDVLSEDLEIAGRALAHVFATSTASTADWVVRLCDVHPDGTSINVCDGVLRVRDSQVLRRRTVDLWSTSMVFRAGHRLRVHVANSSFPRWDRTVEPDAEHRQHEARIVSDAEHPSVVVLPVRASR